MRGREGVRVGITTAFVVAAVLLNTPVEAGSKTPAAPSIKDGLADLISHARQDLNRVTLRERADSTFLDPPPNISSPRPLANILISLTMPVVGLNPERLYDSWDDPREGGRRRHRGIDIFAPRGTHIVAVTDASISYIGNWGKGGRSLWLTTEEGVSFYYAHLDRWVPGLYEGMPVRKGDIIGYVGNTGNALDTPPHLHFAVIQNDEAVNPYPVLQRATRSVGQPILSGGFTGGSR